MTHINKAWSYVDFIQLIIIIIIQQIMTPIVSDVVLTKGLHSKDPIDRYIFDHSLRYTAEQRELLDDIKTLPGKWNNLLNNHE